MVNKYEWKKFDIKLSHKIINLLKTSKSNYCPVIQFGASTKTCGMLYNLAENGHLTACDCRLGYGMKSLITFGFDKFFFLLFF